ncbi:MAG TPA: cold shock domain-containing protein [Planctomycetes bacterium]|nr:cold shock domain-containing protein [Planctomycetota bacterium]
MINGTVKWFDNRKGFGFLNADTVPGDIFVHYSKIEGEGFRTLNDGDPVTFELEEGEKGYFAFNVRPVNKEASVN